MGVVSPSRKEFNLTISACPQVVAVPFKITAAASRSNVSAVPVPVPRPRTLAVLNPMRPARENNGNCESALMGESTRSMPTTMPLLATSSLIAAAFVVRSDVASVALELYAS